MVYFNLHTHSRCSNCNHSNASRRHKPCAHLYLLTYFARFSGVFSG